MIRIGHQGEYTVLTPNDGSAAPPHWYCNLKRHPHAELQDGGSKRDYVAREAAGAERAVWRERAAAMWPDFDRYTVGLARAIPLFVLRPGRAPQ